MIVQAKEELDLATRVLESSGVPGRAAATQARHLVEADLRDQHSHGLQRLPVIVQRIAHGVVDPVAAPVAKWVSESFLEVDGRRGLGPVVSYDVLGQLVRQATASGLAMGAVRNSNHLGMLACYAEDVARDGYIAVVLTTSEALVHPWGGSKAMVGTNPIAVGVPTNDEPFVLDMSTGAVSRGKILAHARDGRQLEPGWAVDAIGNPATDAAAAVDGAISPFGGAKGYALGLALELLVAALTRSALGEQVRGTLDVTSVCNKGDLFLVFSPERLGLGDVVDATTAYLSDVRRTPLSPGASRIDVPGDGARRRRQERLEQGIPIPDAVWASAEELLP